MTWVITKLTWANLFNRPMSTVLTIATLLVAVALISVLLQFTAFVDQRLERDTGGVDLVVGAKGSPLQLILSSLYHIDIPTGNIPLRDAQSLMQNPQVGRAIPLALGDSFRGFRIVGTSPDFLNLYDAGFQEGSIWKHEQQVVIGARIKQDLKINVGQKFASTHGLVSADADASHHEQAPYEVVGILEPTGSVIDRLILTSVESVWHAHGIAHNEESHEEHKTKADHTTDAEHKHEHVKLNDIKNLDPDGHEITALLVEYKSPIAAVRLPRFVNAKAGLQAAVPAVEVTRLFSLSDGLVSGARVIGILFILIGGLSIFVTVSNASAHKAYDIALLRSMGASPTTVFLQQLTEGFVIAVISSLLGIMFAHMLLFIAASVLPPLKALGWNGSLFTVAEIYLFVGTVFIGIVAVMWPAIRNYKLDPIILLKRGR
jgi:putative ABC transport system permease protein